jgi:ATP-dependent exoDNAse (exonuclease V) beta subunit
MKNTLIRASAGTGKTFALATRMIRLLLLNVEPHHVVALTFSRAAAGEIFNKIAERLAQAASSDAFAQQESGYILEELDPAQAQALRAVYGPTISRATFVSLLRKLIATQHASLIGTIDSFMTRIVQAFPLELGLQGQMTIMEDYRIQREKNVAVHAVLSRAATSQQSKLFFDAFRLATFGRETKSFAEKLAAFLDNWHDILLDCPAQEAWGQTGIIWPAGSPLVLTPDRLNRDRLATLADRLRDEIGPGWGAGKEAEQWNKFCEFVRTFNNLIPSGIGSGITNVLNAYSPHETSLVIKYYRMERCFTGQEAQLIRDAIETLYGLVLHARCQTTQGIYTLMTQIEAAYDQKTRNQGLLTFADIPRLITRLDEAVRQNIEYRFDSRFSHWALDEFQDTSHAQWNAIRNLVDEALQSDQSDHSLFIVGDMKQAIYGWRGGDVAIFEQEAETGNYELEDLNTSYRYCPQIAEAVNRIFDGERIRSFLVGTTNDAGTKWQSLWRKHVSKQPDGYVQIGRVRDKDSASDERAVDPYIEATSAQLQEIQPWTRGLSAAILVRANDHGKAFAEGLRREGIPAVWEGESAISDTPVVTALLHLLQVAEHPDNTLAWEHVCATPLSRTLFQKACSLPREQGVALLSQRVLDDVSRLGLSRALSTYIEALGGNGTDSFTQTRLEALLQAATQFTASADPETTLSDFATFVDAFTTRDVADTSTVKILTIHRSKGLGFDLVFVPLLEHQGIDAQRPNEVLCGPGNAWLLTHPGQSLVAADEVLAEASSRALNSDVFEGLCVNYVAMTRAKRALYVLLKSAPKKNSEALYFSNHIESALGGVPFTLGDLAWFTHVKPLAPPEVPQQAVPALPRQKRQHIRRVTPSSAHYYGKAASELFTPQSGQLAADRGTRLHEALSTIEWLADNAPQPADISKDDLDLTVESSFRAALSRPQSAVDLWRETSFELVVDGQWISGTFDRVVFVEEAGRRKAVILDFKSNRRRDNETEEVFATRMRETYASQMISYCQALVHLSKIPARDIRCTLLLTDTRQAVSM